MVAVAVPSCRVPGLRGALMVYFRSRVPVPPVGVFLFGGGLMSVELRVTLCGCLAYLLFSCVAFCLSLFLGLAKLVYGAKLTSFYPPGPKHVLFFCCVVFSLNPFVNSTSRSKCRHFRGRHGRAAGAVQQLGP